MNDLLILDRDGVICETGGDDVAQPQWRAIPGSLEAIARLNRAGVRVVVATNESDIRRRGSAAEALHLVHDGIHRALAKLGGTIEAFFFCPCLPRDNCDCLKPGPGMLHDIASRLRVDLSTVSVVGDELCDLQAATAAGALPVLVLTGHGLATSKSSRLPQGVQTYPDLATLANALLEKRASQMGQKRSGGSPVTASGP